MFVVAGQEVDEQLDREVQRVERELERNFDGIQRDVREELDRRLPEPTPSPEPHVQVVVVVHERLHDLARPAQVQRRADEHVLRALGHERVDELLRRRAVDLVGPHARSSRRSSRG